MSETKHPHLIPFTVDGQPFETTDADQQAQAILVNYAKVDPANYQLGELEGHNPEPKLFANDQVVHIHTGARFVTVRIGPGPVE